MAHYVQVVAIDRVKGGNEEGGWWYDWNTVTFQKRTTKRIARKVAKQIATELCDEVSGEVELAMPGHTAIVQKAYKGRNRFSVLGGTDYLVIVTKRPMESTTRRMRYE